jgi:flavodoxin I
MTAANSLLEGGMKILVTYYSKSGNTEKVARAIYEAVDVEKAIMPVKDVQSTEGYDIVFVGFPVHAHSVPTAAQAIIRDLKAGQKVAFFSTHGSLRGGQLARQAFEDALGLAAKATVLGHFGCRGKVDPRIIEMLMKQPENRAWAEEARSADSHPDAADLADAKAFALEMFAKVR